VKKTKPNTKRKAHKIVPKIATPAFGDYWDIEHWPTNVFPHTPAAGRHAVRSNMGELAAEGVISRQGRTIVVNGDAWRRWLMRPKARKAVHEFENNLTQRDTP
jgi:hypothetical protein